MRGCVLLLEHAICLPFSHPPPFPKSPCSCFRKGKSDWKWQVFLIYLLANTGWLLLDVSRALLPGPNICGAWGMSTDGGLDTLCLNMKYEYIKPTKYKRNVSVCLSWYMCIYMNIYMNDMIWIYLFIMIFKARLKFKILEFLAILCVNMGWTVPDLLSTHGPKSTILIFPGLHLFYTDCGLAHLCVVAGDNMFKLCLTSWHLLWTAMLWSPFGWSHCVPQGRSLCGLWIGTSLCPSL